jgi:hypothetical protein
MQIGNIYRPIGAAHGRPRLPQQHRQLRDIGCDPSRLIAREQVGRRPWPRSRNGLSGAVGAARPNRRCRDVLIVKADRREPLVILRMSLAPEIAKPGERRA